MTFVFKDYNRPSERISSIPIENLDTIKTWLDSCDIIFSESTVNFNWENILNNIKADPDQFIEDGAWKFLFSDVNN